jgi:hypothetical protein
VTEKNISTQIPVIFQKLEEFEKEDSRFLKVKIWLMHTGKNFNGSFFSKEAVEKAIPTLANTPILSFIEENSEGEQDFSDHRMVLHRSEDGDFNFKYLGSAVGVIPEVNNAHWEMRVTDSGEEKEYLVVDALMWTKWGDPTDIMTRKGTTAQSMELSNDYSGSFDKGGVFHFETFSFFGACLLGTGVLPAMESSTVEVQFTENNALQKSIENKLQEFYTLFSQQGGTGMEDIKVEENFEANETVETEVEVEVVAEQFEAPVEVETVEEVFEAEVAIEEVIEEIVEIEAEIEEEVVVEEVEIIDYELKFNDLSADIKDIQAELDVLKTYKRNREEEDLQAKFADKLSTEEFTQVFTEMKESELDKVEEKLFALIGKKNFSVSKPVTQVNKLVLSLPKEEEVIQSPYGNLFEKHNK